MRPTSFARRLAATMRGLAKNANHRCRFEDGEDDLRQSVRTMFERIKQSVLRDEEEVKNEKP